MPDKKTEDGLPILEKTTATHTEEGLPILKKKEPTALASTLAQTDGTVNAPSALENGTSGLETTPSASGEFKAGPINYLSTDTLPKSDEERHQSYLKQQQDLIDTPLTGNPVTDAPLKALKEQATERKNQAEKEKNKGGAMDRFLAGANHLYANITEAPAMLWNTAASITDPLAHALGAEGSAKIEQENAISKHFKDAEKYINDTKPREHDQSSIDYLKKGDLSKTFDALGDEIAESLPASIGLMAGGAAGVGVKATAAAGTLVFGADKKAQLDADPNTKDLPEMQKNAIALSNGFMETALEGNLGISKLGALTKQILEKSGKEAAEKFANEGFKKIYAPAMKQWVGTGAENVLQEGATQFSQNIIDKYWGVNPDKDLSEGVAQAMLQGLGAHAVMTTPVTALSVARTKTAATKAHEIIDARNAIKTDLASEKVSDEAKVALHDKLRELNTEEADLHKAEVERHAALPEDKKIEAEALQQRLHKITNAIIDPSISEATRETMKTDMAKVDKEIEKIYEHKETAEPVSKDTAHKDEEIHADFEKQFLESLKKPIQENPEVVKPKTEENATEERKLEQSNLEQHQNGSKSGEAAETSRSNSNVKSGEKQEEVVPETVVQPQAETVLLEEKKPVVKQKQELIDEEEQIEAKKEDDVDAVKKLNDDISALKQYKGDVADKKFKAIIERAFKMKDEGKISKPTYTKYRNIAQEVLGPKVSIDAEKAKFHVEQMKEQVKKKILGEGYKKVIMSAPGFGPKQVADLIDLTAKLAGHAIDAGFTVKESVAKALEGIKNHPYYNKLIEGGHLDEKEFSNQVKQSFESAEEIAPKAKKEKTEPAKKGKRKSIKSLSKNLYESEHLVDNAKEVIKKLDLQRDVHTHDEAREKARTLIDEVGPVAAMRIASDKTSEVPGNVKGFLFGHIINDYNEAIKNAKTPEEKEKLAQQQADTALNMEDFFIQFERQSTEAGRFIGSLGEFYKMSPLGIKKKFEKEMDNTNKRRKDKMKTTKRIFTDTKKALDNIDKKYEKLAEEKTPTPPKKPSRDVEDIRKERDEIKKKLKASLFNPETSKTGEQIKEALLGKDINKKLLSAPGFGPKQVSDVIDIADRSIQQTKLLGELAGNYIEEGVVRAKELVTLLNKDLKEFGYKLSDDDITAILDAEYNGKTIREQTGGHELEKELADKKRVEQLKIIEKAVAKKTSKLPREKAKKEHEKMIDIWDKGVSGTEFEDAFYEKFGLANAREKEVQQKLDEFSEKIHNAPEGVLRNKEKVAHLNWLTDYRTKKRMESGISYWYANILSSYETHLRNIQFNGVTGIVAMPSLLAIKKLKKGDVKGAVKVYSEFFTSLGEGWQEAKATAQTGNVSRFEDVSAANALERGGKFAKIFTLPSRMLRAEDAFFTMSLYNAKQREIFEGIVEQKAKQEGKKLSSEEKSKAVMDLLGQSQERIEGAYLQAETELEKIYGPDWKQNKEALLYQKIRANEIIEQSRPLEVRQDARAWAKKALLTNKPEGTFGAISDMLSNAISEIPVLRAVIPFVNVPLNLVNQSIERSPLGLIKAYTGTTQPVQQLIGLNKEGKYRREFSDDEKSELKIKAWNYTIGVTAAATAVALSGGFGDDDENAGLIITKLEGGWNRNQAIQKGGGLEPYSVYIGGKNGAHFSYQNTPLAPIFSAIGAYRDYIKYGDDENKSTESGIAKSFISFLTNPLDQASLKGMKDLLKYADPDELKRMSDEGWSKQPLKMINSLFPYSGLVKATTKDVKGLMGEDSKKATENYDYLTAGLPFDYYQNDKIDIFGRPIKEQASIPILPIEKKNFGQNGEDVDAMYKTLLDHDYDPTTKFIKNKNAYTDKLGDFEMSKQELYELNKLRGEILQNIVNTPKKGVTLWDKMNTMDNEDFGKHMDKALQTAKEMAVIQMFVLDGKLPENQSLKKVYKHYKKTIKKGKSKNTEKVEVI